MTSPDAAKQPSTSASSPATSNGGSAVAVVSPKKKAALAVANSDANSTPKKNRPKDTRLRQQKLPAWQPVLTASTVIPVVFAIGIVFIPIGVVLYVSNNSVVDFSMDYTNCRAEDDLNRECPLDFSLDKNFEGDVYFYYGLENYYQNHRRYMKSRNDAQLNGNLDSVGDCEPYDYVNTSTGEKKVIAPCGAVANSMFNDTFALEYHQLLTKVNVPLTYKGVVWPVDKDRKFKNPPGATLAAAFANSEKPPNWQKPVFELDTRNPDNNGFLNTDFIVWMRTAALPTFRKLYRILDRKTSPTFANGLPAGNYTLTITYNYEVRGFGGAKTFVISTTSWAGGKNVFLGVAYMIVGSICIVLGFIFLVIHVKLGGSFADIGHIAQRTEES